MSNLIVLDLVRGNEKSCKTVQKVSREEYNPEALMRLVRSVTFFKDIYQIDPQQFELLMSVCEFVQAPADDVVLRKGDEADTLYFLLKGQMSVYNEEQGESLNLINPGEVFGTLSMVTGRPRSATVKAESSVVLLGISFHYFNDIDDFSMFTMETKLIAYRMVVHTVRWTLEMNKMREPQHPYVARLLKAPVYHGEKGGKEELLSLQQRAQYLAELLGDWNESNQSSLH